VSAAASLWAVRYHPYRAFLLLKVLYLLLSADLCLEMVEHGGRYAVGGFNVAHFAWLDRLLPLPGPELYVGMLIACALLALQLLVGPCPRALRLLLAALYTLSWMVSLHDSYQHHYLISWLLIWCAAIPEQSATEVGRESAPLVRGWGFPMTAITCAIVYTFTGISKCEQEWRTGHVLRVLTHSRPPGDPHPGKFDAARDLLLSLGLDDAAVWRVFALSTIALQWVIACGYLAAVRRDEPSSRWRPLLATAGLLGSICFHATAELFRVFEIGLFSYYMLAIAIVLLAPSALLRPLVRLLAALARPVQRLFAPSMGGAQRHALWALIGALLAALLLVLLGFAIPLPGAAPAAIFVALLSLARAFTRRDALRPQPTVAIAISTAVSALVAWALLTLTSVPFDYYRRTAGELRRMGQPERALELYRMAERHAPETESRAQTIRELERELGESGPR